MTEFELDVDLVCFGLKSFSLDTSVFPSHRRFVWLFGLGRSGVGAVVIAFAFQLECDPVSTPDSTLCVG